MSRTYESPTRKAQAEETRRRILLALVDLLVEERPGTLSIPQVAQRAEVSVRIVYHYFPTKEALLDGLHESIDDLLVVPSSGRPTMPTNPAELIAEIPAMYRFFEANARIFRALVVSEVGERVRATRREQRGARTDAVLEGFRERLAPEELRRLRAVVGLLASFDGYSSLTTGWDLSTDEAASAAAWTVRTLCDRARRSGVPA